MIPKKIHYCWFGGNPLPPLAKKCIASWRKHCPEYEIIEWNESNFDIACCEYVREAYEAKKWAFVSDYARFKILYEYGGLYFDTDVEIVKPFDDIVNQGAFMGVETAVPNIMVNPGLGLGVPPGSRMYEDLLNMYDKLHFFKEDSTLNLKTIVEYTSEYLYKHGLCNKNEIQFIEEVYIYPKEYFNPCDMNTGKITITSNTYSIHHYAASWVDSYSRFRGMIFRLIARCLGLKNAEKIQTIFRRNNA